jgi:Lamin-B receptor of TUDOR domain
VHTQAAYNNISEIELEECDVPAVGEPELSLFPVGTKVAKQFENNDQQLVWFEGAVQRYDEDDNLYWVLYSDGDSEDMNEAEVRDAAHNYRVHLQQNEATVAAANEAVSRAPSITNVDVDMTDTTRLAVDNAALVVHTGAGRTSQLPELRAAMQAMTAAAERLASAATCIEAAVQHQHVGRPQQPEQMMSALPNWQMLYYWQHVRLQQQQQQQQRLVYYQHQQLLYWQQRQQQMHNYRWLCRR